MKKILIALALSSALTAPAFAQAFSPVASPASNTTPTQALNQSYTYSASVPLVPVASIVFQICGSASKIIHVRSLTFQGSAATAGGMTFQTRRLSGADTTGTAVVPVPANAANPTPTAGILSLPSSAGTSLGRIYNGALAFPLVAGAVPPIETIAPWLSYAGQPFTLVGAAQCIDAVFAGTVPTTPLLDATVTWTEE